ncbi:MAG: hypothetical protein ACPGN3_15325 [Opitutales bacterium]
MSKLYPTPNITKGSQVLLCVVALCACLHASGREVLAMYLTKPASSHNEFKLVNKDFDAELSINARYFSKPIEIPAGEIELSIVPPSWQSSQELPNNAQTITIPEDWDRIYLLFAEVPGKFAFPAQAVLINASSDSLPSGNTFVFNFSDATVRGKFGDVQLTADPKSQAVIQPPRTDLGSYRVDIFAKYPEDDEIMILCGTKWLHEPNARKILFITPPQNNRKYPSIRTVQDFE